MIDKLKIFEELFDQTIILYKVLDFSICLRYGEEFICYIYTKELYIIYILILECFMF